MMFKRLRQAIRPSKGRSLARGLYRLGWTGFWFQVVFGAIPLVVMAYYFAFSKATPTDNEFGVFEYLTIADLLILAFTAIWSYRYTRLARRMLGGEPRPSEEKIVGVIWTGVVASTIGILMSMIVILIEVATLLFYFLKAPQGGLPVIQTSGTEAVHFVSAVDMVSLMALHLTLFAELLVLVFSLWLLFQATLGSADVPQAGDARAVPAPAGT
jgi:hypothetical protein